MSTISSQNNAIRAVAIALLVTVATQIFYIAIVSGSGNATLRPLTWFIELFAFAIIAIGAHAVAAGDTSPRLVWSAVALSGTLNLLQVAMGLSMFGPAQEAMNSVPELFTTVLAGAFFLYFLAKLLIGLAALLFGAVAFRRPSWFARCMGLFAILSGSFAIALNLLGMIDADTWTFAAGAAGTAATAFLGLILAMADRNGETADG